MGAAYVGYTLGTAVTATSIVVTRSHTVGNASVFIVHTEGVITSVTFDAESAVPFALSISSTKRIYAYVKFGVSAGNHTWTANQASARIQASITEASGANSIGYPTTTYTSAGSTAWTLTINPVMATDLMIGADAWEYGHSVHGADHTKIYDTTYDSSLGYSAYYVPGTDGSTDIAFTSGGATPVDALAFFLSPNPPAGTISVAIGPYFMF